MIFFTILVILAQFSQAHNGHFKIYFCLLLWLSSVQSLSHIWWFVTPFCSMPGFPIHHQLPEPAQTHAHWVSDTIQSSVLCRPPLLLPAIFSSIKIFFQWVSSSHQVAKVLKFQLQNQSFQWIFRIDFLSDGLVGSPSSPRDSQESFLVPQFKSINSLALRLIMVQLSHLYMTTGKTIALTCFSARHRTSKIESKW